MLIDQHWVAVGIEDDEARRAARRLVRFALELQSLLFEALLQFADIGELVERLGPLEAYRRMSDPLLGAAKEINISDQ